MEFIVFDPMFSVHGLPQTIGNRIEAESVKAACECLMEREGIKGAGMRIPAKGHIDDYSWSGKGVARLLTYTDDDNRLCDVAVGDETAWRNW